MNDFANVESDTYWLQGWKHLIKTVPASVEQLAHPEALAYMEKKMIRFAN